MVSYKTLYNELKESINIEIKTGFKCPKCESELVNKNGELYCLNNDCSWDKTFGDLLYCISEYYDLKPINEEN